MNRPTNTALRVAGIVLALSGLGGALTGCSGSDGSDGGNGSDGGAAPAANKSATKAGLCEKLAGLGPALSNSGAGDAAATRLQAWIADMEAYGTPSELSDDERKGVAVLVGLFKDLDGDVRQVDLPSLERSLAPADDKKMKSFSAWANKNCVSTSSDPSPTSDSSGDAS